MATTTRAPSNLNASGRSLYKTILAEYELDDRETRILVLACRQADALDALEAAVKDDGITVLGAAGQTRLHPAVVEARQGRIALARLLGQLSLPPADDIPATARGQQARKAARARWNRRTGTEG